jgi:hypothetical protein
LYQFGEENMFHQVLQLKQVPTMLQELHGGVARGFFSFDIIVEKILDEFWKC